MAENRLLNSDMKTTVVLLIANIIFLIVGLTLTPPQFLTLAIPIATPFIVLYAVFAAFCLKEKRWSYSASSIVGVVAVIVIFAAQVALRSEAPVVFQALLVVLPVLLAMKSFEAHSSFSKKATQEAT